jgi:hypothetical protein
MVFYPVKPIVNGQLLNILKLFLTGLNDSQIFECSPSGNRTVVLTYAQQSERHPKMLEK